MRRGAAVLVSGTDYITSAIMLFLIVSFAVGDFDSDEQAAITIATLEQGILEGADISAATSAANEVSAAGTISPAIYTPQADDPALTSLAATRRI